MLVELSIENLGIIQSTRLNFSSGFTVFTGETGAGKTMLVEAINLVCGRRAESSVIRDGADEAIVEARFVRSTPEGEEEIILSRTVHREGRSRAYINGRMATVSALAELGDELVDIHGQHAHQRLLSAAAQRDALDQFGGIDLSPLVQAREAVTHVDALLGALGGDEKSRAREIDLLSFQCDEIENARLVDADEDAALSREEDVLADVVKHQEMLARASDALSGDSGAFDALGTALRSLNAVPSLAALAEQLAATIADATDIAHAVRSAAEGIEENPERLEEIRLRRQLLKDLTRKYGDTIADVMSFGAEARSRLDELLGYADRVAELERERQQALTALHQAQLVVGHARRAVAEALAQQVQEKVQWLAMPHAQVRVSVGDASSDPAGDSVVFMLSANPGSAPQPLSKVASGGELARVMLALRLVLSEDPATMVFDEVDAGIGGAAAVAVAGALRELGERHQVFAVTHLAQVAASAHQHVTVAKTVKGGHTFGSATMVSADNRPLEIARMLSGGVADDSALAHARDILAQLGASASRPATKKRASK